MSDRKLGVGVLGVQEGRSLVIAVSRTSLPARHARVVAGCDLDQCKFVPVRRDVPDAHYTTEYDELPGRDGVEVHEERFPRDDVFYFNWRVKGVHYGEFAIDTDAFARALLEDRPHAPDLEEGVETVCMMGAVRRSALAGGPLAVAPVLEDVGLRGACLR